MFNLQTVHELHINTIHVNNHTYTRWNKAQSTYRVQMK
jgi:hypothetical protein